MGIEYESAEPLKKCDLQKTIIKVLGRKLRAQKRRIRTLREFVAVNEQTIKELKGLEEGEGVDRSLIAQKMTSEERWAVKDDLIKKELQKRIEKYTGQIKQLDESIARLSTRFEDCALKLQDKKYNE